MSKINRRDFFKLAGRASLLGGALAGVWGFVIQPFMPKLFRQRIVLKGLGGTLRIAQLSDFHAGPQVATAAIGKAIEMAGELSPDMVVITGDFVSYKPKYTDIVTAELARLSPPLGIYAVFGNHDHWAGRQEIWDKLLAAGIQVLENQGTIIESDGARLYLCGVDDIWEGADDLEAALAEQPPNMPSVLLCHNPDFIYQAVKQGVDLMLSGHTHGGQVKLPLIGTPVVPSAYGDRFVAGYYAVDGTQLYVNRGIGCINPPIRFGVPPEVTLLELVGE